jgi:ArsR family metal-binding transcriptional regulator
LESAANIGNNAIKQELKNMALDKLKFEDLFERLLQNQELIVRLEDKIKNVERLYPELDGAEKKKNSLILELDNLIIKLYQISPTLIDYNRLMQGEEGIIVYFDIETKVDTKRKNSNKSVNIERMKSPSKKKISELFKEIDSVLSKQR